MKNFRTFQIAVEFYRSTKTLPLKGELKDQLNRASLSIALNLSEGRGRAGIKDQKRFFTIAFGSTRECEGLMMLESLEETDTYKLIDKLAAHLYKLIQNAC